MPRHQDEENEVLDLIGNPKAILNLVVENKEDKEWILNELAHGGPKHKQVYSSLLLQRAHKLIKAVEKESGETFTPQKGMILTSQKEEAEVSVPLVLKSVKKQDQDAVVEALSHSPAHEIIAFNTLLQAIEWSIATLGKNKTKME